MRVLKARGGEGNGNPLQFSCLENPKDRAAWWAAVYGVTQSRTQLTLLSSSSSSSKAQRKPLDGNKKKKEKQTNKKTQTKTPESNNTTIHEFFFFYNFFSTWNAFTMTLLPFLHGLTIIIHGIKRCLNLDSVLTSRDSLCQQRPI